VTNPQGLAIVLQLSELFRMVVAMKACMTLGRREVLTNGQDVKIDRDEVPHDVEQFVMTLTQPNHDSRLSEDVRGQGLRPAEEFQAEFVGIPGLDLPEEPGHRLEIVVEDIGSSLEDGSEGVPVPLEIRDQHLDPAVRQDCPDLADGFGEDRGAAIGKLIPVN
jgi:hypothetical protein